MRALLGGKRRVVRTCGCYAPETPDSRLSDSGSCDCFSRSRHPARAARPRRQSRGNQDTAEEEGADPGASRRLSSWASCPKRRGPLPRGGESVRNRCTAGGTSGCAPLELDQGRLSEARSPHARRSTHPRRGRPSSSAHRAPGCKRTQWAPSHDRPAHPRGHRLFIARTRARKSLPRGGSQVPDDAETGRGGARRLPTAPGRAKLLRVIGAKVPVTLSRLESRFLARLRKAGLPVPVTNRLAGGRRVDCRWAEHKLIVELDGYRFHNSRYAWEQDRLREREARTRGDEFRRYSWADVCEEPEFMLNELRRMLA